MIIFTFFDGEKGDEGVSRILFRLPLVQKRTWHILYKPYGEQG